MPKTLKSMCWHAILFFLSFVNSSFSASIIGIALVMGNTITPVVMERFGRRSAHLITTIPITVGYFIVVSARAVPALIIGRFLQGVSMGMLGPLSSILIGEYTSPKNRGVFLMAVSLSLAFGTLFVHTVGTWMSWQYTALICSFFNFTSLIVVMFSPETPSWLASKGRYDECRVAFEWLRGVDNEEENDELEAMIDARQYEFKARELYKMSPRVEGGFLIKQWRKFMVTMRKKEFSKPILVMMHLYTMYQFAGMNVLTSYMVDILHVVIGEHANPYFWMIMLDGQRLLASIFAVLLISKLKRRTLLYSAGSLCVLSQLGIATYVYTKRNGLLAYDAAWIPITLVNLYMFSLSTGITPIPFTVAGEIFPVAYRSLGSGISALFLSSANFLSVKTAPAMFAAVGIHGTYSVYAGIVTYCLAFVWFLLPETKDRTLQEIEEEFRGTPLSLEDFKSLQSLRSVKSLAYHDARRPSNTILY